MKEQIHIGSSAHNWTAIPTHTRDEKLVNERKLWCIQRLGAGFERWYFSGITLNFYFYDEDDAFAFTLCWGTIEW